jgi:feruloyl esterase
MMFRKTGLKIAKHGVLCKSAVRLALGLVACLTPGAAASCSTLLHAAIPHTQILIAQEIDGGRFVPPNAKDDGFTGLPAFCRVVAAAHPVSDSDIRVEVWLPVSGWNGRELATGNGGFAGSISYGSLANGIKSGHTVANTDMGMAVPPGADASVFVGRPERWRDWGYRATHEMSLVETALIHAYYGRPAAHRYFSGCSTGGEQALMEAQRFPDDYDGIIAGAPANNRTGVHISILWNYMAMERKPEAYLPQDKLALLHAAVLKACDPHDGLQDGSLRDPFSCSFDPRTLSCKVGETSNCLSAEQVETVRRVYAGPIDPATGKRVYPGVPKGSELDWGHFGPAPGESSEPPYSPIFRWVFGKAWNWRTFDLTRDPQRMEKELGKDLNATDGNLTHFRNHGGKLIAYHGLADWLVVPGEALNYRASMMRETKGNPDEFYRLYLIPGMAHCGGGVGPDKLSILKPLEDWVEKDIAPGQMLATGAGPMQRPICNYPHMAKYRGSGDANQPASFVCVTMPAATP